ncbi:MAG TPA: efflux RND transporter periplasmic adaptor subunit [Candidatus Acidoferrales bacterium]|jgi:cobalt-zinc-cadmium efflux system membrane fusion protein|nr:efflux RND transporter periplasmic adaptor subunit [Candidatus Acidoferrales bacterium]
MNRKCFSPPRGLLTVIGLLSIAALAACSGGNSSAKSAYADNSKPNLFSVPKEQLQHLQLVTVEPTDFPRVLRLTGTVAFNGSQTTPVITQVSGPVSRLVVSPGQHVNKGQAMLYVSSPDYSQLRANYLKARDAHALAHKNYVRSKDLYAHHAIAERDLQTAESAEIQAQADLQAAEQSLKVLGIAKPETLDERPLSSEVPLLAPISGEAVERLCSPGQVIQAGSTQCFTISNMKSVWVLVNVYENQLASVHVGDPVSITTDAYPDVFHGRISFMGAALDPTSRTLQARIDTANPGGKLKKDMYITATVAAGKIKNALLVPDSAVLRDAENEPFVYVQAGDDQFARRPVKVTESYAGQTQVVSGLQPGERVVGQGSLFLQFANSLQ